MVGLAFDIDWTPEKVIEDTMGLLAAYKVKGTFLITHDNQVVKSVANSDFEIGLHPNLNPLLNNQDFRQVIGELQDIYPEAREIRSHLLTHNSPILDYCKSLGLEYDVNRTLCSL